jgi:class 3 adenylate cyclase
MTVTRRLAAIVAADVAGYSRLMGADEEGTLERLNALRRELVAPKIAEHHGRIVKTTGDGLLVEFANVIDAVRCAVEVQQAMPSATPASQRTPDRIAHRHQYQRCHRPVRSPCGRVNDAKEIPFGGKCDNSACWVCCSAR